MQSASHPRRPPRPPPPGYATEEVQCGRRLMCRELISVRQGMVSPFLWCSLESTGQKLSYPGIQSTIILASKFAHSCLRYNRVQDLIKEDFYNQLSAIRQSFHRVIYSKKCPQLIATTTNTGNDNMAAKTGNIFLRNYDSQDRKKVQRRYWDFRPG